jgi:hypothetical protein
MSDFPDFDAAYKTVLIRDPADRFEPLAAAANFNIYHSDLWRGTARRFAEYVVQECARQCGSQADRKNILKAFGLPVDNNVKYPGPPAQGSVESQYQREYNIPGEQSGQEKNQD